MVHSDQPSSYRSLFLGLTSQQKQLVQTVLLALVSSRVLAFVVLVDVDAVVVEIALVLVAFVVVAVVVAEVVALAFWL